MPCTWLGRFLQNLTGSPSTSWWNYASQSQVPTRSDGRGWAAEKGDDFIREKRVFLSRSTVQPNGSAHLHLPGEAAWSRASKMLSFFTKKKTKA
jgi:hypothetical protein